MHTKLKGKHASAIHGKTAADILSCPKLASRRSKGLPVKMEIYEIEFGQKVFSNASIALDFDAFPPETFPWARHASQEIIFMLCALLFEGKFLISEKRCSFKPLGYVNCHYPFRDELRSEEANHYQSKTKSITEKYFSELNDFSFTFVEENAIITHDSER